MSNPYYKDDLVTLYHGDCLEITDWLAADVLVTDPPYGIAFVNDWLTKRTKERRSQNPIANDASTAARDTALALWGDRPALVFGRWDAPRPTAVRHRLIWDKGDSPGMGDLGLPWGRSEEEVYVIGKGFIGARGSNVIRALGYSGGAADRPNHPTPKPIGLMEALIGKTVGTLADPFAGSGATLIAARNLGRQSIGVELEERYCELIAKRLSQQAFDFGNLDEVRSSGWAHV